MVEDGGNVVGGVSSTSVGVPKRGRVKAPNPMSVKKKKALATGPMRDRVREDEVGRMKKRNTEVAELDDDNEGRSGEEGDEVVGRKRKRKRRGKTAAVAEIAEGASSAQEGERLEA